MQYQWFSAIKIRYQCGDFIRIWVVQARQFVVGTAFVCAPLIVLLNEHIPSIELTPLHLLFMLALWKTMTVACKTLYRDGTQPTAWENLCAGFAAGAALIYSLSFWPFSYCGMGNCVRAVMDSLFIHQSPLSALEVMFALPAIALGLMPVLLVMAGVCLSPLILLARTIFHAWNIRRRMLLPSNLLPAGVGLAFLLISVVS
jgi:hypothetical protein